MKESPLQSAIIKYLDLRGHYPKRLQSGALPKIVRTKYGWKKYFIKLGDPGTPDILCCVGGLFVAIEVKRDEKELKHWHGQWERFQKSRILVKSAARCIAQHGDMARVLQANGIHIACADLETLQREILKIERIAKRLFNKAT